MLETWQQQAGLTWHGRTDDVAGVWRTSDIAVVPALGGDGLPRAMLEAAASGRPLIVSDVAGCRQFVRDGREGFIVPPGDAEALARALVRLAHDPALRARLGSAARARFMEGYTDSFVRARIRRAYDRAAPP
jgi:glycosyltransferase involved in cell wall biosynthesis